MAITSVKVHPSIGIARVGNSPDEFFIGPERPWDRKAPDGGYKDSQCRVKRQAARFRLFAYHDDGTVDELTAAEADITWTVHVRNKKAITRNSGSASDLTIDPGAQTLTGPNQQQLFNTGTITLPGASAVTVPLGEARTDTDGFLIVLGGDGTSASPTGDPIGNFLNNPNWYDDTCDGPVTATVTIHSTGDTHTAVGGWVIVAPPKFSPATDNVITLYDTIFNLAVSEGWLSPPSTPSYTNDIYPVLERARQTKWTMNLGGTYMHTWVDPVIDPTLTGTIFDHLRPVGNMPALAGGAKLTDTQYAMMEAWKDGNYTNDWSGPPSPPASITPAGLDEAALENCVGAAFYPGIEAGGVAAVPVLDPANYAEPFRFGSAVSGGDITEFMALPWQADFFACATSWWPVPRPNNVFPQGSSSYADWARGVGSMEDMVTLWHTLGFVVKQGDEYVEVDRCDASFITLITPSLVFQDVPQGPMGMARKTALAIVFEVKSTGSAVTLEFESGPAHARLERIADSVTVGPTTGDEIVTARLWITYETGADGENLVDQAVVRDPASGQTWTIDITANTVPRKIAAASLVLDRSGSMSEDRGDGDTKHHSLQEAASIFVDVMLEDDGIALVRYNHDAQLLQPVTALGPAGDPFDTARADTKNIIAGSDLNPSGNTSIGDGIHQGRLDLNAAGAGFDVKSLVVLTDGKENRDLRIADVADDINELTYSVGLGTPANTSAPALQNISGNNGGYLLITGDITGDNRFILQKYFLQILAGISNAEIVMDPEGALLPGTVHKIPFQITEADSGMDVILLTPVTKTIDFRLLTPNGLIIEPWRAVAEPNMRYVLSEGVTYYRLALPTELVAERFDQAGTWHALLNIGKPRMSPRDDVRIEQPPLRLRVASQAGAAGGVIASRAAITAQAMTPIDARRAAVATGSHDDVRHTLPYSLLVHSYSNLSFRAVLEQPSHEPGATVVMNATLAESGIPMARDAHVRAEVTRPDGTMTTVPFEGIEDGRFRASYGTFEAGVYRLRVRASGQSRAGHPFQREQTLTVGVWRGGDRDADPAGGAADPFGRWLRERDEKLCKLFGCLFGEGGVITPEFERRLEAAGVDVRRLRHCLEQYCRAVSRDSGGDQDSSDNGGGSNTNRVCLSEVSSLLRQAVAHLDPPSGR